MANNTFVPKLNKYEIFFMCKEKVASYETWAVGPASASAACRKDNNLPGYGLFEVALGFLNGTRLERLFEGKVECVVVDVTWRELVGTCNTHQNVPNVRTQALEDVFVVEIRKNYLLCQG